MTRPIYEPSLQRTDRRLTYGKDQLFRRPAPSSESGTASNWAYLRWDDGDVLPATDASPFTWFKPPGWNLCVLSPDASASGLIYPDVAVDDFRLYVDANARTDDDGAWYVEVHAKFDDNGTPPVAGDYFGIGNLVSAGASYGNEDIHGFAPAKILLTYTDNKDFSTVATRVTSQLSTDFFFEGTVGCFTGGVDMWVDKVEMTICQIGTGQGVELP